MKALNVFFFFVISSSVFAGPQKFNHLDIYKATEVNINGPKTEKSFDAKGSQTAQAKYFYNANRQLSKIEYYRSGLLEGYTLLHYKNDRLISEKTFTTSGKVDEELNYSYDARGRIKKYTVSDSQKKAAILWKFSYQNKNNYSGSRYIDGQRTESFQLNKLSPNLSSQSLFNSNSEKIGTVTHNYRDGLLITRILNDKTGIRKVEYSYDIKRRLKEIKFFKQEKKAMKLVKKHIISYSALGKIKSGIQG